MLQLFTIVVIVNIFLFNGYFMFFGFYVCAITRNFYTNIIKWNLFSFISWFFRIEPKKINYCIIILILKYKYLIYIYINNINSKTDLNPSFEYQKQSCKKKILKFHKIYHIYVYIIIIKWNFLNFLKLYFLILFIC